MGPSPAYHPPEGEECETLVEHGLPLWAETAVGYRSRRPRPSPMWGSRFVGARAVGPWVGDQKPLGKTPQRGNPSPESTYLPTLPYPQVCYVCLCVSPFSPRRGSRRPGFADVGPKVLIRYNYHSYGAQFLCWRLSLGEDGKSPTY